MDLDSKGMRTRPKEVPISIALIPETERHLREQAERIGEDVDSLAAIIAEGFSYDFLADDPDDLTDEQMAESRAGISRGLEAAAAGRVKTLAQVVAETRRRHGFPSSWARRWWRASSLRNTCEAKT